MEIEASRQSRRFFVDSDTTPHDCRIFEFDIAGLAHDQSVFGDDPSPHQVQMYAESRPECIMIAHAASACGVIMQVLGEFVMLRPVLAIGLVFFVGLGVVMADEKNDDVDASLSSGGNVADLTADHDDGYMVVINESNLTRVIDCSGANVRINGNDNELRLRGDCGKVKVIGSYNEIKIEAASSISSLGSYNEIFWERGIGGKTPRISSLGSDNSIEKAK
jgi:hypothetical protein